VTSAVEPAGTNCTYGGTRVTDGATGAVSYVCNGATGGATQATVIGTVEFRTSTTLAGPFDLYAASLGASRFVVNGTAGALSFGDLNVSMAVTPNAQGPGLSNLGFDTSFPSTATGPAASVPVRVVVTHTGSSGVTLTLGNALLGAFRVGDGGAPLTPCWGVRSVTAWAGYTGWSIGSSCNTSLSDSKTTAGWTSFYSPASRCGSTPSP
jgi:hypothetical protein